MGPLHQYVRVDAIKERTYTMKKVLLTLLTVVVVLGLFAAVGFAGYRFGYMRGAQIAANGGTPNQQLRPFDNFDRPEIPRPRFGDDFGRGFQRGFRFGGGPMMGMGFGIFSLFGLLMRLAVFALILWFIYWLFTRSGWRLTRTVQTVQTTETPSKPAETTATETEIKEE